LGKSSGFCRNQTTRFNHDMSEISPLGGRGFPMPRPNQKKQKRKGKKKRGGEEGAIE